MVFLSPCQDGTDVRSNNRVSLGVFKTQLHSLNLPNLATGSGILVLSTGEMGPPRKVQVPTPSLGVQLNFKHDGSPRDWLFMHMGWG